jgi:hypothetical protein
MVPKIAYNNIATTSHLNLSERNMPDSEFSFEEYQ